MPFGHGNPLQDALVSTSRQRPRNVIAGVTAPVPHPNHKKITYGPYVRSFCGIVMYRGGHQMARQERFRRDVPYKVSGPAGKSRKMKYVDQFTVNGDKMFVFRALRKAKRKD